jgi:hypothetical protein
MSFFLKSKKGQGLSISFIVVLAIALVVMAVVIMIFVTKANKSSDGFSSCEMSNGLCVDAKTCIGQEGVYPQRISGMQCPPGKNTGEEDGKPLPQICCLVNPSAANS